MRAIATLVLTLALAPAAARADGRGQGIFDRHCAHCHVVGQGAPVAHKLRSLVDITLAARAHDDKWLMAFVRRPYAIKPDSECHAKLDAADARLVVRFLHERLRPAASGSAATTAPGTVAATAARPNTPASRLRPAIIPPAKNMHVVPPPAPPTQHPMERR